MKSIVTNLAVMLVSILTITALGLAGLELVLRTGALRNISVAWVAPEDAARDAEIDAISGALAARHPYGFTDLIHPPPSAGRSGYSIAVVGDSFVWGDGLLPGQPWPHKLRRRLTGEGTDATVQVWGINGWSTRDQLAFLKAYTRDHGSLGVDKILIAFVTNDLDMGLIEQRQTPAFQIPIPLVRNVLPLSSAFVSAHVAAFYERFLDPGIGYGAWEASLWTAENLQAYRAVLEELQAFSAANNIPVTFVLTPHRPDAAFFAPKYDALKALLEDIGLPVIDVLPAVVEHAAGAGTPPLYRELWANPGDGHPGEVLTDIYANEVVEVLRPRIADHESSLNPVPDMQFKACDGGEVAALVRQPIRFRFGPKDYVRLVGEVAFTGGTGAERATTAHILWPGGQAAVYQRDVLAGDTPRVYDRANFSAASPASTFWADIPADADVSALFLRIFTAADCFFETPLLLANPPVNLSDLP